MVLPIKIKFHECQYVGCPSPLAGGGCGLHHSPRLCCPPGRVRALGCLPNTQPGWSECAREVGPSGGGGLGPLRAGVCCCCPVQPASPLSRVGGKHGVSHCAHHTALAKGGGHGQGQPHFAPRGLSEGPWDGVPLGCPPLSTHCIPVWRSVQGRAHARRGVRGLRFCSA